jgi:predicted ester cyclase
MKKQLPVLVIVLCICFISCMSRVDAPTVSAATQKNLDANRAILKTFETQDFSKLGDYIAADAVDHGGEHGDIKGLDSIKAMFVKSEGDIVNPKIEIIKELGDDNYVMCWNSFTGVYKTDGMGHKAGDTLAMKSLDVSKFVDGKAVEHWLLMEPGDVMKMMASMQPKMAMDSDSTKTKKH